MDGHDMTSMENCWKGNRKHPGNRRRYSSGFTLTEILVAVAIMSVIAAVLMGVLFTAMQTARSGEKAIEAYGESRTALQVIERDLNSAFINREYGDVYQFYGTPAGMTFIGVVRFHPDDSASANLARVTYVLHPTVGHDSFSASESWQDTSGNWQSSDARIDTYALIRYVEPGVNTLDDFPINWDDFRAGGDDYSSIIDYELTQVENLKLSGWAPDVVEDMLRAKKRQLWIRLLSGWDWTRDPFWSGPSAPVLNPPYWPTNFWQDYLGVDPMDYVVAQNIRTLKENVTDGDPNLRTYYPPMVTANEFDCPRRDIFFRYGISNVRQVLWAPFWNGRYNMPVDALDDVTYAHFEESYDPSVTYDPNALDDPNYRDTLVGHPQVARMGTALHPRLPELVWFRAVFTYPPPAPGANIIRREVNYVMDVPSGQMRTVPGEGLP